MRFSLFIAKRIFNDKDDRKKVSRPAIVIATTGVAIGLAVMILTVAVVMGFKHSIRDKVMGFGCHLQVEDFLAFQRSDIYPLVVGDSLMDVMRKIDGVSHVQRYASTNGILKTDEDFLGIQFKGIGPEYDTSFLESALTAGEMPVFSDSMSTNKIVVSQTTANLLRLEAGDRIFAYFINSDGVRTRRFTVAAIFQTNMSMFDSSLCFTDLYTAQKINGWEHDECSGAEVSVENLEELEKVEESFVNTINRTSDGRGHVICSRTIYESYPSIFGWIDLLDINVWIILALMICLAGITMISGLLIIILERTQMIGVLKALGAKNSTVRATFLWFATFIIGRGMLIGDAVAVVIMAVQNTTGLLKLDPATYYINRVPMEVDLPIIVAINVATLIICVLILVAPSFLVSHIRPARSMRYE